MSWHIVFQAVTDHKHQHLITPVSLQVREKALKALKDRLIERANIIQARLDEETSALSKRQQNFQRDRDQMTQEEEEEYEKAVEESRFRWVFFGGLRSCQGEEMDCWSVFVSKATCHILAP